MGGTRGSGPRQRLLTRDLERIYLRRGFRLRVGHSFTRTGVTVGEEDLSPFPSGALFCNRWRVGWGKGDRWSRVGVGRRGVGVSATGAPKRHTKVGPSEEEGRLSLFRQSLPSVLFISFTWNDPNSPRRLLLQPSPRTLS